MRKDGMISYFGNVGNVAEALGTSHASASGWGDIILKGRVLEIRALTDERLKVNPTLYMKPAHSVAKA